MTALDHAPIDLLDRAMYAGDPYPTYAWLREHAPVDWSEAAGLWGVSRYDDIIALEKQPELFSNGANGSRPNTPRNDSMIDHDDPRQRASGPMILIAEMLGVRPEDRDTLQLWSDVMLSGPTGSRTSPKRS